MKLELLQQSLEIDKLSYWWLWYPFHKATNFFHVFTLQALSVDSYQRLTTFLSRSRLETSSLVSKFGKPPKPPIPSLLQNHHWKTSISIELTVVKCTSKPFYFDLRANISSIYVWTHKKPQQNLINIPLKNHSTRRGKVRKRLIKEL
jgi:hypothetical protein